MNGTDLFRSIFACTDWADVDFVSLKHRYVTSVIRSQLSLLSFEIFISFNHYYYHDCLNWSNPTLPHICCSSADHSLRILTVYQTKCRLQQSSCCPVIVAFENDYKQRRPVQSAASMVPDNIWHARAFPHTPYTSGVRWLVWRDAHWLCDKIVEYGWLCQQS